MREIVQIGAHFAQKDPAMHLTAVNDPPSMNALDELIDGAKGGLSDAPAQPGHRASRSADERNNARVPRFLSGRVRRASVALRDAVDPVSFLSTLAHTAREAARHPSPTLRASNALLNGSLGAYRAAALRSIGRDVPGPVPRQPGERRFNHPSWEANAYFFLIEQNYLLWVRYISDLIDAAELDPKTQEKARFAAEMLADGFAPTNALLTNPEAIEKAMQTGGRSVARGLKNFAHDMAKNKGWPRMADASAVELGKNMAATPGKVVFRNDLMELIQYSPQTETVHEIPLLCSPAWINRYYIMDLAPGKSLFEWAVQHGHTVFTISYRNPDASMSEVSFSDYMIKGPISAINAIRKITGSKKVNLLGVCIGGTLATATTAFLNETGEDAVQTATLLNSHTDFSIPGTLGVFADESTIGSLERRMSKRGYADGNEFSRTFNLLRANDLIWNYVREGWLMGEDPPVFDLLAWNGDSTNLPAKMHSYYLRSCYVQNALARDQMWLAGKRLRPSKITQDVYVVGAVKDHIVPWQSSYKATQIFAGEVRFVLSSAGHIAGMINPPHPKASFRSASEYPEDPEAWREHSTKHSQSWWEDWIQWLGERSGELRTPPAMGAPPALPVLDDAPGMYVRQ